VPLKTVVYNERLLISVCLDIEEIPDSIRLCSELQTVDFSNNPIQR